MSQLRSRLAAVLESRRTELFVQILIFINAIILGLETVHSVHAKYGVVLDRIDQAILLVFIVELGARFIVKGPRFFLDPWSVFDFVVVAIALIPATGPFAVLRALRVLRVLRLITTVQSMRRVVSGLLGAIPGMASVMGLLVLIFYVSAVIATRLFGETFPQWFGSLGASAYSLFQIMTLESWSMGIVRPVMERHSWAWMFFVPYILVATYTMLNLFIAVIVGAMQSPSSPPVPPEEKLKSELSALREEIASLRRSIEMRP
jgi:voltage-gated sodium channel